MLRSADATARSQLRGGDVLIVWLAVAGDHCDLVAAGALLSEEERARADRYRLPRERVAFVLYRAALRRLIARELGGDPADVVIDQSRGGRPTVVAPPPRGLAVSTSRRGAIALVALARGLGVGVDVERVRADLPVADVARLVFGQEERARVVSAADPAAFFRTWTRWEARVKVSGIGLAAALRPEAARCGAVPPYVVRELDAPAGHVAALASTRAPERVGVEAHVTRRDRLDPEGATPGRSSGRPPPARRRAPR